MPRSLPVAAEWFGWFVDDLRPTPGRLASSLRITATTVVVLVLMLVLQIPFVALALYIGFILSRESPATTLRAASFFTFVAALAVFLALTVVIATDNDPMARLLSVTAVTFVAGMLANASPYGPLAPSFGFLYCTVIALWEKQTPADAIVKNSLFLIAAVALDLGCSVLVEYLLASRSPVLRLQWERKSRYQAIESMFRAYARGASKEELHAAYSPVAKLALAGQRGMQELYNTIAQRTLDPKNLPLATRVQITLLAELVDVSAAFATANPSSEDPALRARCGLIADRCRELESGFPQTVSLETKATFASLRRVEETLTAIAAMPVNTGDAEDNKLIILPITKVPFLRPGELGSRSTLLFASKISFCATLCYIAYHALDYPGISTAVTTVLVAGLSSTGAMKQKLAHRLLGSTIGGLLLGIGSVVFLFPYMDSITALCASVAVVSFIAAWCAAGRRFRYVGLQIAFSFFTVALATSKAPSELAPARDRLIGIGLALIIMWFVFDQVWPVRTITMMRLALARILHGEARLLKFAGSGIGPGELAPRIAALRHAGSADIEEIRTLHEAVLYEFGTEHERHKAAGETILRAAVSSGALLWNEIAVLQRRQDGDLRTSPRLLETRSTLAGGLETLAQSVTESKAIVPSFQESTATAENFLESREAEYAETMMSRFRDIESILATLSPTV